MSVKQISKRTSSALLAGLVFSLGTGAIQAQSQELADRVRALNGTILELHAPSRGAAARQIGAAGIRAAQVLRERADALEALIETDPAAALTVAFSDEALAAIADAFPESAALLESHGMWAGEVEYIVEDDVNLASSRTRAILRSAGEGLQVSFAGEPASSRTGDILAVSGVRMRGKLAAARSTLQAAAASSCSPAGEQRIAVLMVTYPGQTPPAITREQVASALWGTSGRTLDRFWREASYGKTWAAGDVYGWFTLDAAYTCSQTDQIRAAAIAAADPYVNFQNYGRIFILMPNLSDCGWAGLANTGCPTLSSAGDGTFIASTAWLSAKYFANQDQAVELTSHEGGHNLGLMHARSRAFTGEPLSAVGTQGTVSEYGDPLSTMGYWNFGHYNAPEKEQLAWHVPGVNTVSVQSGGTYLLQPTETPSAGVQGLKVQRGTGNNAWVYLEYRQPIGSYDSTLPGQVFTGALLHYKDSYTSSYSDLLDFNPGTSGFTDAALAAGQTWVDPYSNLTLTIGSAANGALPVTVGYGAPVCVPATPQVNPSPSNPALNPGQTMKYAITIKNNDSAGCPSASYNMASAQPAGWPAAFSAPAVTLAPGQSASVSWNLTVPSATTPATYPVTVTAAGGTKQGSAAFNCTVVAAAAPLAVSVGVPSGAYSVKSNVPVSATVLSGTTPVSGAAVSFTVTEANGTLTRGSATTGSNGVATWTYRIGPKDPAGIYSVTANATYGGQSGSAPSVQFTVR